MKAPSGLTRQWTVDSPGKIRAHWFSHPTSHWRRIRHWLLSINTSAQAGNHENLQDPIEINYQTTARLQVLQAVPSEGTEDVDPESAVFVAFNQPVVALGREADAAPAFTLSPEVQGTGQWLNTSTYIFYPSPSMSGGATYTVHINEELESTGGASLDLTQQTEYQFSTTEPEVLSILPLPAERLSLDGPLTVKFNIRMDAESVEQNFSLTAPEGEAVQGSFAWAEDLKSFDFTPEALLERSSTYTVRINPGAQSFGGLAIQSSVEATRTTYPAFAVSASTAPDFQSYYANYGQYRITFTTPLNKDTYEDFIQISPEVSVGNFYLSDNDTTVNLSGYFKPETNYTITLKPQLQDRWGGELGQAATYTFTTPPAQSSLTVITGDSGIGMVFIPAEVSELVLQGTNVSTINLEIAPIGMDEVATLLNPQNYDYRQSYRPAQVETYTRSVNLTRNESQIITLPLTYQGGSLEPGAYYLGVSSPDISSEAMNQSQKLFLIVSDNHMTMKISPEQVFVWVTNLSDLASLAGVPVSVYTTDGDLLAKGETDANGLFVSPIDGYPEPYTSFYAVAGEPGKDTFAFSVSSWGLNYALYQMGISLNTYPPQLDTYIYTDRPIYRPGTTIYFKAVIFGRENGLPVQSGLDSVDVSVSGNPGVSGLPVTLFEDTLTLDDFGTVSGEVLIPEGSAPGYYHIEIRSNDKAIGALYFDVANYRKPEIEVSVGLTPQELLAGEPLGAAVQADYYFGVPVSGQTFDWTLYRHETWFSLPGYRVGPLTSSWLLPRVLDYSPLGTTVANGTGTTDAQGHASLEFNEVDMGLEDVPAGSTQQFNLEVTVTDDSGFPVSYRDSAVVHPEDFYIGVRPEAYFGVAGTAFDFSVLTVDWDQQPVGNIPLKATFETIEWEAEETGDMEQPYQYVAKTSFVASASAVSGADGKARLSFTPEDPGTYQLTLRSGNAVTQVVIWVSGSGAAVWPRQSMNQIELTPDAELYQPGQIAQVFFPNPFNGAVKALVTVERGKVIDSQILDVDGSGLSVQIPLDDEFIPNVYVSVLLLGKTENGDPDYRQGIINLPVAPIEKTLNVELTLDPALAAPGDPVEAILKITDASGDPVQGEFSVAVVDKAVLALVEPNSSPILDDLYGERPLSVQTSYSLKTYTTQLALNAMELGRGGGGDDMESQPSLREEFPDTAFWQADVVTGADGTAKLEIPLPDLLTTWVVDVRGLTDTYQVGQAEGEIVTQKELMIRPVTPRFLVAGDEVEMAAIVHNNTSEERQVDVALQTSGFKLSDSAGQSQTVTIPAMDSVRVAWWGTVDSVDSVALIFQAQSGELSDASKPTWGDLSVLTYTVPNTFSTSGQLAEEGQRLELVSLPSSVDTSAGVLTVELTPSLTSTLIAGLEAMENLSYKDSISILSRLMANLTAWQALTDLGVELPQLEANLEDLVNEGVRQLLDAQQFDGGWSWWAGAGSYQPSSDAFITAYVLLGLEQAAAAGIEIDDYYLENAVDFLSSSLERPSEIGVAWQLDRLAFEAYALRNSDVSLSNTIDGLYNRRSELSPWAQSFLALTIHDSGGSSERVNTLLSDLEASAIRSATGVHWESERVSWLLPGTPIFNTSVGIYTLAKLDPASSSLPMALRYLLAHRNATGIWSSTMESSWSLMAITAALQGTGDTQADYDFQASLNDVLIAKGTAAGANNSNPVVATTSVAELNSLWPNALLIERGEGTGTLYYRADLQTYQSAATADPINKGISLSRQYYLAGDGCPGAEDCTPIASLALPSDGATPLVTVAINLVIPNDMYNLMIEDYIPSGTEVLNQKFLTAQTLTEAELPTTDPRNPLSSGWGWWYFNQPQIYDDHLLWTANFIPAGTYTLTYQILPFQRGTFQVLPTRAWQYFFPEVQGTSGGDLFTIE